jgi:predicted  nucleic acid-binding Zn-ribbon protein
MAWVLKGKQSSITNHEQQIEKLQQELMDAQETKSFLERELNAANNEVANSQADVDQLSRELSETVRESDRKNIKISELKQ